MEHYINIILQNDMASLFPIDNRILFIREQQVMIDKDLAELYNVETKRINEQIKRNKERFPEPFCFQLSKVKKDELVANCDRFLIIDSVVYQFGASLKDLGKKWFAFSKMELSSEEILENLEKSITL